MAKHVAASEEARGMDPKQAERIGYATVNARKSGKRPSPRTASRGGGGSR